MLVASGGGNQLSNVVINSRIANLTDMKSQITQHVRNLITETFQSYMCPNCYRFQLVAENGGQRTEHVLHKSSNN